MGYISLIHPSRSRPEIAEKAAMQWLENPRCDVQHIVSLDASDPLLDMYRKKKVLADSIIVNDNKNAVEAINVAAQKATGEILVVMSDDFIPFDGWGKSIFRLMSRAADWILKTQDGIQPWIITLPIMDHIYYQRFGYIYHPSYKHMWCDTEMTCVAELTGRKAVSEMTFVHLNKTGTKIEDEVSKKNDATFEHGRRNFIERKKRMFDMLPEEIEGKMSENFYTAL